VFAPADALAVLAQTAGADLVDADRDAATELARLCGHLPLALRIAAGRLADQPRLTIRHHVQELAARGRMAQLRMAGDEQADLRDAFDLSYQVLASATQRLFRLLGLVPAPAGWSTGAAAALAAVTVTEVEHLFDALARLHLVKVVAADRYEFHDLLLEYAGDLAVAHDPPSQRDAAVHRLLDFYLHTTDHAATLTFSPTSALPRDPLTPGVAPLAFMDAAHARDWMIAEWANIVAVQRYAAAYGPRSMAWQLTDALRSHLYLTVTGQQWLAIAETGLTAARAENDALGEAASRFCLGLLRSQMAEYASAVQQHGLAAKLYRQAQWKRGESAALRGMGVPLAHLGQTRLALEMFHQSLVIDRDIGNQHGEAANLNNIASAHAELGEPRKAARHLAVAIPLLRSLGRRHGEAIALISQSELSHKQGRLDEALITLEQSLAICRERGYRHEEAEALTIMGQVQRDAGRYSEATAVFLAGLHLAEHHHHLFVEVLALNGLATVDIMLGRAADATARLNIVLAAASRTGHHRSHVDALITLCYAACAQAQHQTAHQHATQALALARQTGSTSETARVNTALAAACLGLGDLDQSLNHAQRALEAQQRAGQRLAQTRTLRILARAHQLAGHDHDAEASRRQAIALADEIGTPYWRIRGMG
jgi:tetratricopeptide (TPR) repeat protein